MRIGKTLTLDTCSKFWENFREILGKYHIILLDGRSVESKGFQISTGLKREGQGPPY